MNFQSRDVYLEFGQDVIYETEGQQAVLPLEGGTACDACIRAELNAEPAENRVTLRMTVTNIGTQPVILRSMNYLRVKDWTQFRMGDGDFARYQVFRQGRHKNDLPSVFTLGTADECFRDAAGGMLETGDRKMGEVSAQVHSDSLTMFHYKGRNLLLGFLTGKDCFVECTIDPSGPEALVCGCVSLNIRLMPGGTFTGEKLLLRTGPDENRLMEEFAAEKRILAGAAPRKKTPSVFCTWYYYGLTVTEQDVMANLREIEKRKLPFDVYQVDEGWEITLGEWSPNHKFPRPMKEIADEIRGAGMTAGIWTSPFIAHATASVWKDHPEWMLKDRDGKPYEFPMNDTVYLVFDITNPAVDDYFTELYRKLTLDWGYTYHKLDFTRAAVIYEDADFYDKTVTLPQAYRRAVSAIRRGMGEESFFLMCGGLYDPIIGLVDGQRMGSDVLSMWVSDINRDGKALPFTVKQNLFRYYMNEWWSNDPDALMVRRQKEMSRNLRLTLGLLNEEEVKTATVNQYVGGGLVCSTEPLAEIDGDRLYQLKHVLPIVETKVRTLGLFSGNRFPQAVRVEVKDRPWRSYVLINWEDEKTLAARITVPEEEDYDGDYIVSEFYSGRYRAHVKAGETFKAGEILPHGCAVFKIEREDDTVPHIVGSNAHYSMGGEVKRLAAENGRLIFEIDHRFEPESVYQVLIPGNLSKGGEERVLEVRVEGIGSHRVEVSV